MPAGRLERGRLRTTYLVLVLVSLLALVGSMVALVTDQPQGVVSLLLGVGLGVQIAANAMRWAA